MVFTWVLSREVQSHLQTRQWIETPCHILESEVRQSGESFRLHVLFEYTVAGVTYRSSEFRRGGFDEGDVAALEKQAFALTPGAAGTCFVNPSNHSEAVLTQGSLAFALILLFPLVFVLIGAGGLFFTWRRGSSHSERMAATEIVTAPQRPKYGSTCLVLVLFVGAVTGTYYAGVRPVSRVLDARHWTAQTCTVLASDVRSHQSDDGTTYSVEILYSYEVNGRSHRANRYTFFDGSSSGYAGKREIVERYPEGETFTCYVNPNDPFDAVIERGFVPLMLIGLIPFAIALGLGLALVAMIRSRRPADPSLVLKQMQEMPHVEWLPPVPTRSPHAEGFLLSTGRERVQRLFGIIFITLFWNGIVSVFVYQAYADWVRGNADWFLILFLTPFLLVGALLVLAIPYTILGLFNPKLFVYISTLTPRLGEAVRLHWRLEGGGRTVDGITVSVKCIERISYREGKSNTSKEATTYEQVLGNGPQTPGFNLGEVEWVIPADGMHSFQSSGNRIRWELLIHGKVSRWPDIQESYEIVVLPAEGP